MSNAVTDKYVVCEIYVVYMNEEVKIFFAYSMLLLGYVFYGSQKPDYYLEVGMQP